MATAGIWNRQYLTGQLALAVLHPVRAYRPAYLPLLMVYFASGALGITAIAENFWVKDQLTISPAELAALGIWLTLPWTIKMVFGEMVDTVAIFGSQRRAYVYIGAGLVAAGLIVLAAAAARRMPGMTPETAYKLASFMIAIGVVIQDVVADAMTTEVVPRTNPDGTPRDKADIDADLGMVQVLGRLAMSLGGFLVAGLAGALASVLSYATVFLLALAVPAISASGAALVPVTMADRRPIDWRILGGGMAFGAFAIVMALIGGRYNQEIVFFVSMAVVIAMLQRVIGDLDVGTKRQIFFAVMLIFVYRATPSVGQGYAWFTIDVLGFDELFQGTLSQIATGLALAGTWLLSNAITRQPVARVLLWLTIATTLVELPGFGLTVGLHEWTERNLGFGARTIALADAAATSPFVQLSAIPLLTLCAIYAPAGRRASWFALMASLMSLSQVAGGLLTKYLNEALVVTRGDYENLPLLLAMVLLIGFVMPIAAIVLVGRRLR